MKVYLDNAATTAVDPDVFEAMKPYFLEEFGNPSSIHSHGRRVRSAIERSRKQIAELLNTSPAEIFFTSGGTEADNMAIRCTIEDHGVKHVISSKIEHHAVLHTLEDLAKEGKIQLTFVELDGNGVLELSHLEELLNKNPKSLVSLMHGNNEIANINDIYAIGDICSQYGAVFHSDTVQTMGHFKHDLEKLKAQCIVGSAHKFHGPKGVGFLYLNAGHKIRPYLTGGAQERNMRGGTENVTGIVGMAKALEMAYSQMDQHASHIKSLKQRMITKLTDTLPDIRFNGTSSDVDNSLYTVLSVCTPPSDSNDMLLFNLDINGVSASGGSACSSGSDIGSHVLAELDRDPARGAIRFSFSKFNTEEEVDYTCEKLAEIIGVKVAE